MSTVASGEHEPSRDDVAADLRLARDSLTGAGESPPIVNNPAPTVSSSDPMDHPSVAASAGTSTGSAVDVERLAEEWERNALEEAGVRFGIPVVITRSFNHTGPGERRDFVAPALAQRVIQARSNGATSIMVGNLDVHRDLGDVRDVVRAYRLLLEAVVGGAVESMTVVNVATGATVSIRAVLEVLCRLAGVELETNVDPSLVRADDPPVIVGDASALRALTGWSPQIELERTLADLLEAAERLSSRGSREVI